ncbi:DUF4097 family beta strand repeat protein [Actinomadura sp. NAK00032]|uniref:DUF4097 family beta strand repeat-containing protein n=1 Tax=Actinomadura sp. NAK00032 TaxID=2742128 RepID=UPI00158FFBD8|nr:DUF4097 family beta strand repeat-containing protein [Actinomadura sp. NAK00032]QKW37875.1 DUF4097 family beta strand repeat protein [Actinomadura sp. NAK00032]
MTAGTGEALGAGRPRRRGVWIALAVATALVVVTPALLSLVGRAVRQTAVSVTPYHHAIRELRLDLDGAAVSVGPGPDGEARVYKTLRWGLERPGVTETLVEDVLFVTFRCGGSDVLGGCGADIDVRVPAGTRVSAVSGSGEIDVRGLTGDLDLRTGSGEIGVAGVRGRLRLEARSGAITGTGLAAAKTLARVSSGALDLRYAEPPDAVEASAGSGTAKIIVPPGSRYRVRAGTGSGSTHLNPAVVDEGAARSISVHSGSGTAYLDYRDE